jgi:ABC-2 type transport system permease protein
MPILLIFLSAALTMRMWSEERRSGTLEHVLTLPAGLWRFVMGKFRACLTLLVLALLATLPLPITAALIADLDWGPVAAGYLASCLLGATYISAGLFVSARTDNPIVSLIGTVLLCGGLYLVGSDLVTGFFDDQAAAWLRGLGSGARFESITRGVLDIADLAYYVSLTAVFLVLNVYLLERERWAKGAATPRHRHWRIATVLLVGNFLLMNLWLGRAPVPRLDLTEGRLYSISDPSREVLSHLREPLLIRGYFSARNHPLLAPLVPQLKDLLQEYVQAGAGRIRVEFIDPATAPDMEQEANDRYGIRATPFQVADRHQAALVNSYFNVLIEYGSEHTVLGFTDLVEVRTAANAQAEVALRNPEYDITRAIREVLQAYQSGGNLFTAIDEPVEFIAYVSGEDLLPDLLLTYRDSIAEQLQAVERQSAGKLSVRFIEPEARGGAVARQIEDQWGFKPMVTALDDEREFFFYMTLANGQQVVQLPTEDFDPGAFRAILDAGLRRFARGFTRTVALALPPVNEQMARQHLGAPTFVNLERAVGRDYNLRLEDLSDGSVVPAADILAVIAPQRLNDTAIFALDQFLMRGGTVILATSPFTAELSGGQLRMQPWDSGLQEWLAHHGLTIDRSLVLDEKNATFPTPILRRSEDLEFQDVQMVPNPYVIDVRRRRKARDHPITAPLPYLTMAFASPISVERSGKLRVLPLLRSSRSAWRSSELEIMPVQETDGSLRFPDADGPRESAELGLLVEGRFDSFFAGRPTPALSADGRPVDPDHHTGRLSHSTESARIVLYASNDFMDDQILNASVAASGTQYLGPLELFMNTLDWALQDEPLLDIRSRGNFNRTLPPMSAQNQSRLEYLNYALAVGWLLLLALVARLVRSLRRRRYARGLGL